MSSRSTGVDEEQPATTTTNTAIRANDWRSGDSRLTEGRKFIVALHSIGGWYILGDSGLRRIERRLPDGMVEGVTTALIKINVAWDACLGSPQIEVAPIEIVKEITVPENSAETSTSKSNAVTVTDIRPDIALVTMDTPGSSANVLTIDLFAELDRTFERLQSRTDLKGLILWSAKPSIFVAGADLRRIAATLDWPDERIAKFCDDGRAVMARLSQMPFLTVAAIHGACVGGGLELTLWCDRRIASDDRKTILGLPETKLGLVPGWAGTVRLPRIASLETGIDLVTSGRLLSGSEGLAVGFVDRVCSPDQLLDTAVEYIEQESSHDDFRTTREELLGAVERSGDQQWLRTQYSKNIDENQEIHPFAASLALEHMLSTAEQSHAEACQSESQIFAKVYGSPPNRGLLNNFFLTEHNKKQPGFVDLKTEARPLKKIGIVGAGVMGRSIALIGLQKKCEAVLWDVDTQALESASQWLSDQVPSANLRIAESCSDFSDCDLVLESVVENREVKRNVLKNVETVARPEAVIATNTSAIELAQLSESLQDPSRFCGVHFCHPQLMQLVEVVRSEYTTPETVATIVKWVRGLRKMPVVVNDSPGFVVNRMLAALLDQALRLYSWGYSIEAIDAAARDFGFRGGPFEIVDVIGIDTCLFAGREMWDARIDCVTLSPIVPRMYKAGRLGRKVNRGFYRYDAADGPAGVDPEVTTLLQSYVEPPDRESGAMPIDSDQIAESLAVAMVHAAAQILDHALVADPRDIDLCCIHGFSFPAHVGGVLFWAGQRLDQVLKMLNTLAEYDAKYQPQGRLLEMQENGDVFYPMT